MIGHSKIVHCAIQYLVSSCVCMTTTTPCITDLQLPYSVQRTYRTIDHHWALTSRPLQTPFHTGDAHFDQSCISCWHVKQKPSLTLRHSSGLPTASQNESLQCLPALAQLNQRFSEVSSAEQQPIIIAFWWCAYRQMSKRDIFIHDSGTPLFWGYFLCIVFVLVPSIEFWALLRGMM